MSRDRFVRITSEVLYALMILVLVTWSPEAHADTTKPPSMGQWQSPVVPVFVGRDMAARPRWATEVDAALAAWSAVGPLTLTRVDTRESASITIRRRGAAKMSPDYGGVAMALTDEAGYFEFCHVFIRRSIEVSSRRALIVHELGHCLGLVDNYAGIDGPSVMSYGNLSGVPTSLDVETLHAIYATPPYVPPAQEEPPPGSIEEGEGHATP